MHKRRLGSTGLEVSEIGFGCWAIGGPARLGDAILGWGARDDRRALAALECAFDHGVNLFDTADIYGNGHSEELLGQAFAGRRDRVVISTKIGNRRGPDGAWLKDFSPDHVRTALAESLRRLRSDYVDLLMMHSPPLATPIDEEFMAVLAQVKAEGQARFIGVSVFCPEQGEALADAGLGDVICFPYNLLDRRAEDRMIPAAQTAEIGLIARSPLAGGFLSGKYDETTVFHPDDWRARRYPSSVRQPLLDAVAELSHLANERRSLAQAAVSFCLRQPALGAVLVGMRDPAQVTHDLAASGMAFDIADLAGSIAPARAANQG